MVLICNIFYCTSECKIKAIDLVFPHLGDYRIRWKLGRNFFDFSFERALNNSENMALKVWCALFQVVIEN